MYARLPDILVLSFLKPHFNCLFIDEAKLYKKGENVCVYLAFSSWSNFTRHFI